MTSKTLVAAAAAMLTLTGAALAEYPEQPVTFIVPWPPGDLEDILTRMIAEEFQEEYGVPAAVVNRPGGGGGPFPGAIDVATAAADGYTVGSFVADVPISGHEIGIAELAPAKFDPIGIFVTYPFVIASASNAPYGSMEELAAYAKDNDVFLGHFGDVVTPTQVTKALAAQMGFSYGGDAAFDALDCNTLASGDADVINTTLQLVLPCLDSITVLTSLTETPISLVPDAPTIGGLVPALAMSTWNGLFVTKDTPQDARDKIAVVAERVVLGEAAQQLAAETGALVYWQGAEESAERIATDRATLGVVTEILSGN